VGAPPGAQVTFTATLPGLNGIGAFTEGEPTADCQVTVELVDAASSRVVGRSSAGCKLPYTALTFPTQSDSAGRTYVARFGGTGATVAMTPWAAGVPGLEQVAVNDSIAFFRVPETPGRYVSPPAAVSVANDEDALALLTTPGYSVGDAALIHGEVDPAQASGNPGTVKVLSQRATEVRLEVHRDTPGWVVARQTWFPGWTATVNGDGAEVKRADVAFSAVAVPGGTSEVILRYRPASVRYGLLISAVSLVGLVVWVVAAAAAAAAAAGRVSGSAPRPARRGRQVRRPPGPAPTS
jgi:Bacterial membrane protein YfhO